MSTVNNSLSIIIPKDINNPDLLRVGEARIKIKKTGNGAGFLKLFLRADTAPADDKVTISLPYGKGSLYDASYNLIGKSANLTIGAFNTFNIKLDGDTDAISFYPAKHINNIGGSATEPFILYADNSPKVTEFDGTEFDPFVNVINLALREMTFEDDVYLKNILANKPLLKSLSFTNTSIVGSSFDLPIRDYSPAGGITFTTNPNIDFDLAALIAIPSTNGVGATGNVHGNLSAFLGHKDIAALTLRSDNHLIVGDIASFKYCTNLNWLVMLSEGVHGDIASIPIKAYDIQVLGKSNVTYTGGANRAFPVMKSVQIPNCTLSTAQIDDLLSALSKVEWKDSKILTLKGSPTNGTTISNPLIQTLVNKGVTVTINPA